MAQTIEDVNGRTLLQQFHGLYKKQQEQQASIEQNANEIATKQNTLTAGENITINNNTISAVAPQNMMTTDTQQDFTMPKTFKPIGNENVKITFGGLLNGNSILAKDESHSYEKTYIFKGSDQMQKVENVETEEHAEETYQKKLTAGTNITIDSNNVISATGGLQEVKANNVNSETATSGQVLTADGSGGASWQNAGSGGDKLYRHNINYKNTINFTIINRSQASLTGEAINDYLKANGDIPIFYLEKSASSAQGDALDFYYRFSKGTTKPNRYFIVVKGSYDGTQVIFSTSGGYRGTTSSDFIDTVTEI